MSEIFANSALVTDIRAALEYLGTRPYSFELILVDDGSSDGTAAILEQTRGARAICYQPNRGKGYAVRSGMLGAKGHYRLFADAGLDGLPVIHGSMTRRLPPGDWKRKVAWPSQVKENDAMRLISRAGLEIVHCL